MNEFFYAIIATIIVSIISLIWILFLWINQKFLKKILIYLVSFSTGALFWDVFIHLLPEFYESNWDNIFWNIYILFWIIAFFIIEKIFHWRHCHEEWCNEHKHLAKINLIWDFFHNFIDWLIIWWAFLIDFKVWVATTIAILLHEIPQEIWDFWILLHSWLSFKKAIFYNFLVSLTSIFWVILAFILNSKIDNITNILIPFAAWSFIYIAWSDLIPELHKHKNIRVSILQLISIIAWIWIMCSLLILE